MFVTRITRATDRVNLVLFSQTKLQAMFVVIDPIVKQQREPILAEYMDVDPVMRDASVHGTG